MTEFLSEQRLRLTLEESTKWYENLRTYISQVNEPSSIASNTEFFAYTDSTGSGASVGVLPLTSYGKNHIPISSPAYQQPIIRAHSQVVQDLAFNPFHRNILYTCSYDKLVKVWTVPKSGLIVDLNTATSTFSNTTKSSWRSLCAHTTADNILAARGSRDVCIIDVEENKELFAIDEGQYMADILHMAWSFHGDYLLTMSKDKRIKLFDPRTSTRAIHNIPGHQSASYASSVWLRESNHFLTFGPNTQGERDMFLWDTRMMITPTYQQKLTGEAGCALPTYDADENTLFVTGKGETKLTAYAVTTTGDHQLFPTIGTFDLLDTKDGSSSVNMIRGVSLLPKQVCTLEHRERQKLLLLSEGRIRSVQVHDFVTPITESTLNTYWEAPPALTKEAWLQGGMKSPSTVTLPVDVSKVITVPPPTLSHANAPLTTENTSSGTAGMTEESTPLTPTTTNSTKQPHLFGTVAGNIILKFKHIYGKEHVKDQTYYNLTPDLSASENQLLAGNETYWSVPVRGGGGPIYVSKHTHVGKVLPDCLVLNGHKAAVSDMAYSPFHEHLLVTGGNDAGIKLWSLDSIITEENTTQKRSSVVNVLTVNLSDVSENVYTQSTGSLSGHTNSIRTITFHPLIPSLLCSTSQDMTMKFFDIARQSVVSSYKLSPQSMDISRLPCNVSFNFTGSQLCMTQKDRSIRVFDSRQLVSTFDSLTYQDNHSMSKYLGRNLRAVWCGRSSDTDPIVTVSSSSSSVRQLCLWDVRKWSEPVMHKVIDNASGQLFPLFDEGLNVVYVAGKGDTIIRTYELSTLNTCTTPSATTTTATTPATTTTATTAGAVSSEDSTSSYSIEKCNELQTQRDPIAGIALLPKRVCAIPAVEVSRLLKLTSDSVIPISYHVPRAEHLKNYFQDDLYPPIRSKHCSTTATTATTVRTIANWMNTVDYPEATVFAPEYQSLQPEQMGKVSERPVEESASSKVNKLEQYKVKQQKDAEEQRAKEQVFNRLQQLAIQNATYHHNLSGPVKIGGVVVSNPQLKKAGEEDSDSDNDWD